MPVRPLLLVLALSSGQFRPTYVGRAPQATASARKVCVVGNSLAVGAPYAAVPVMTRLLQYLGPAEWVLDNKAVGGTRADAIAASYTTHFAGAGCTWVLVEGGTNTVVDGTEGIGTTAWAQLKPAADAALADGALVLLHTIPPRSTGPSYSAGVQAGVDSFNAAARAYALAHAGQVELVDLYATHGEPGTPTRLRVTYDAGDGLHLSQAGQDAWACAAARLIRPGVACGP